MRKNRKPYVHLREKIGGIVFPVNHFVKELKRYTKMRVQIKSGIYIAAVLEYLVRKVIEISYHDPISLDESVIRTQTMRIILKADVELNKVTENAIIPIYSPKRKNEMYDGS